MLPADASFHCTPEEKQPTMRRHEPPPTRARLTTQSQFDIRLPDTRASEPAAQSGQARGEPALLPTSVDARRGAGTPRRAPARTVEPTTLATRPPRAGVYVPNYGPFGDARRIVSLSIEAERAGWDGFFIWDTVQSGFETVDPWVALSACAAQTSQITLGVLVTPVARRRPVILASQLLSLDRLSGGRLVAGVGLGGSDEFRTIGEPASAQDRAPRFEAATRLLDQLLHESDVTSDWASLDRPLTLGPKPIGGRLPVWLGIISGRPHGIRRAATLPITGIFPMRVPWDLRRMLDARELGATVAAARAAGASLADVITMGRSTNPESRSLAEYVDAGMTWWLELVHQDVDSPQDVDRIVQAGPPDWR